MKIIVCLLGSNEINARVCECMCLYHTLANDGPSFCLYHFGMKEKIQVYFLFQRISNINLHQHIFLSQRMDKLPIHEHSPNNMYTFLDHTHLHIFILYMYV